MFVHTCIILHTFNVKQETKIMLNDGIVVLFENFICNMEHSCIFLFICCNILPGDVQSHPKHVGDT
jgi:hypothetical protein